MAYFFILLMSMNIQRIVGYQPSTYPLGIVHHWHWQPFKAMIPDDGCVQTVLAVMTLMTLMAGIPVIKLKVLRKV